VSRAIKWLRMGKASCGAYSFASNQFVVDLPAYIFIEKIDGDQTILFFAGLTTSLRLISPNAANNMG